MKDFALYALAFAGLFPAFIGMFVLFHIFRPQKSPADTSNRINKIRLFWFALTRENLFVETFPWLKKDELGNMQSTELFTGPGGNKTWTFDINSNQYEIMTDHTGLFVLEIRGTGSEDSQPYQPNDPILVYEFNKHVHADNVLMADDVRKKFLVRVPHEILDYLPCPKYPRIEASTMKLEWYIQKDAFKFK